MPESNEDKIVVCNDKNENKDSKEDGDLYIYNQLPQKFSKDFGKLMKKLPTCSAKRFSRKDFHAEAH